MSVCRVRHRAVLRPIEHILREGNLASMALPPLVEPSAPLSAREVERYAAHVLIPDLGLAGQRRLKNARVLVVGAGGLGSPALMYLAAAGVGTIGVADADVVELSNLQRQVVHGVADVGRSKSESAAQTLASVNPLVRVVRHDVRIESTNALAIIADLRPCPGRDRQLPNPISAQRRVRSVGQAQHLGVGLSFRRSDQHLVGAARPLLPLRVPRAATGCGAILCRGWGSRGPLRGYRIHPGG